jgi:hypothetical protein
VIGALEICKLIYLRRATAELARLLKGYMASEKLENMAVMYYTMKTENEMIVLYNINILTPELYI